MRGLNLDQLRSFASVVGTGSFSAAARQLNLSQPAVSAQIRQLEERLGLRLLERLGRRALPTAAGRELLVQIHRIEEASAAIAELAATYRTEVAGRIRLGTGATACIYLLPPVLRDLRRRYPKLEVVVSTGNTPEMLQAVDESRLDAALVTLPAAGRTLTLRPVFEEPLMAVLPPNLARCRPAGAIDPTGLADLPLVVYEGGAHTRRLVDAWFAAAGLSVKPVMELGSVEAIKELVGAGLGASILPRLATRAGRVGPELIVRELSPPLTRSLGLVLRRDKPRERSLEAFLSALETHCAGAV